MLEILRIKNFALMDVVEISFKAGLNIISGETGTGKSIVLEAISLLLGHRASLDWIRSGCEEAVIEGIFNISALPWMVSRLQNLGFTVHSSELFIKRMVHLRGRHRIFVNGELATLSVLQTLCDGLVDLCSQQEHHSLIQPHVQLALLDQYSDSTKQALEMTSQLERFRSDWKAFHSLKQDTEERAKKNEFLKYQMLEIQHAKLQVEEDAVLQTEKQRFQTAALQLQMGEKITQFLESDETGVLRLMGGIFSEMRKLFTIDSNVKIFLEEAEKIHYQIQTLSLQFQQYCQKIEWDPIRFEAIQERLSLLANLKRKYGKSVHELIEMQVVLEKTLLCFEKDLENVEEVEKELYKSMQELKILAEELSQKRKKFAFLFSAAVTAELKDLRMGAAEFQIAFHSEEDVMQWDATGKDTAQFLVQTNSGEPARSLSKIASGGELSRLLLAIRHVISGQGGIGVYLFDEIDSGMSGQTAFEVGKKLKSVARLNQVICITHLPQVAAFADHHLVVEKKAYLQGQKGFQTQRTVTEILELTAALKQEELARMLGGPKLTPKSLANAAELLELAGGVEF